MKETFLPFYFNYNATALETVQNYNECFKKKKKTRGTEEMAQQSRAPTALAEDLGLVLSTLIKWLTTTSKSSSRGCVISSLHMYLYINTHTIKTKIYKNNND